jgi:hypothetical protein
MQEQFFKQATSQFLALAAEYAFKLTGNLMFGIFMNQSFVPLAYILFSHCKGISSHSHLNNPLD